VSRAREGIAYLWLEVLGEPGGALAAHLGIRPPSIYKAAQRGRAEAARWQGVLAS